MLKQRIITALIIAPISIACVFLLAVPGFSVFVGMIIVVSAWEWANLAGFSGVARYAYAGIIALLLGVAWFAPPLPMLAAALAWWIAALVLVAAYPGLGKIWSAKVTRLLIGVVVLVPGFVALVQLKQSVDNNFLILLLFFLIWGADIGAYFTGRRWGQHKLAFAVSPGKSWEGFWGGVVACALLAVLVYVAVPTNLGLAAILAVVLSSALASVLGDLVESMVKRHRGVKDSGSILPGHGGILDRIDGHTAAAPVFALGLMLAGW